MEFYANYRRLASPFKTYLSILLLLVFYPSYGYCLQTIVYVGHDDQKAALNAINQHASDVQMMIAQAYIVNSKGEVSGTLDSAVLQLSKLKSIPLLAMITNSSFDSAGAHQFLTQPDAQTKALTTLLAACKKDQLAGAQFDFEMIALSDKDALTHFYEQAATLFHQNGLIISYAIAPRIADKNFPSDYEKKLYDVWQGAYDFQKLGAASDFVTLMTYDQHGEGTIPGPIATIVWDKKVLKNALRSIPKNKLSLGIPTYSGLWYMSMNKKSKRITTQYDAIPYKTCRYIINKFNPPLIWDDTNKIHYAIYTPNVLNRYLFMEDADSFNAKRALAEQWGLQSISIFRLGMEDPAIWERVHDHMNTPQSILQYLRSLWS